MDARQFTNNNITEIRAYYVSQHPIFEDEDPFLSALKMDPKEKLKEMEAKAREIIEKYEHKHPINQNKIVRRCLAEFENTIHIIEKKEPKDAKRDDNHLKAEALFNYLQLFGCFKTMSAICDNNDMALKTKIDLFFETLKIPKDSFNKEVIGEYYRSSPKNFPHYEKLKYERALNKFETALNKKCNRKEHPLVYSASNRLKKLKGNGIPINFCSLVLNTAAQQLENPTNKLQQRLANLKTVIGKQRDPAIMRYLPTLLKFVGAVVAIVGLALLAPPSLLITQFGAGLAVQTPALTALTVAGAGAATFFVGRLFPSPTRYRDASDAINAISEIEINRSLSNVG